LACVSRPPIEDEASTIPRTSLDPSDHREAFEVRVASGPDAGRSVSIDSETAGRLLIGTSPASALTLTDRQVSRRHAALELCPLGLRLTDVGSTNGTFVGTLRISDVILGGGEVVSVASTALRVDRVERKTPTAPGSPAPTAGFGAVQGASREMRALYPIFERLAASQVTVIIEGETGTGKEVLARSFHEASPRSKGPFVVFDCTAVPANLVESELFGHEKGAFTGATASRRGVFEQADGGTLLVDEIGDLELALQPKLLRALERSEVRRLGSEKTTHVDVRVLAATRRDLDHEVETGRFRDDLYHRLAVARVELPPLRRRKGDVRRLAHLFCREMGGDERALTPERLARWDDDAWPGNVRELRNAVARLLALGDLMPDAGAGHGRRARGIDFLDGVLSLGLPLSEARQRMIDEFEQRYVERVLAVHGGNVTRAAEASGIARRHFYRVRDRGR
jgi:two-component system response regulator HydG